jgi:hypothetical protein
MSANDYIIELTPARWGWSARVKYPPHSIIQLVEAPAYWRPTYEMARRAADRQRQSWQKEYDRQTQKRIVR